MNYIFVPPKKIETNNIPTDSAHFIRTEIDFKKENLVIKKRRQKTKEPYLNIKKWKPEVKGEMKETIDVLEETASHNPGKNVLIAEKKISDKYKKKERRKKI